MEQLPRKQIASLLVIITLTLRQLSTKGHSIRILVNTHTHAHRLSSPWLISKHSCECYPLQSFHFEFCWGGEKSPGEEKRGTMQAKKETKRRALANSCWDIFDRVLRKGSLPHLQISPHWLWAFCVSICKWLCECEYVFHLVCVYCTHTVCAHIRPVPSFLCTLHATW